MRTIFKWLVAIIATMVVVGGQSANAGFVGGPRALGPVAKRISFSILRCCRCPFPVLPALCRPVQIPADRASRRAAARWDDLLTVNKKVNAAIMSERNSEGLAGEKWLIGPSSGDCNDYAVTKRSELLDRGWPTRALLLSNLLGEHHPVLVVPTSTGNLVLDNMASEIRQWTGAPYRWVRIQTPKKSELLGRTGAPVAL